MTVTQFSTWYEEWLANASASSMISYQNEISFRGAMEKIFFYSPYLKKLLSKHADIGAAYATHGADAVWADIRSALQKNFSDFSSQSELSAFLRVQKQRAALLIALADIAESWNLQQVTAALSELAEKSVELSLNFLLDQAAKKSDIVLKHPERPTLESGLIILGMGKLGGYELNYSSDIDLIVFFEHGTLDYQGRHNEQYFLNKLTQDLVSLMQERTAEGYVFRTDLRLRPDPSSTPVAISTDAALQYYESLGQNWERAAMIKARPIAGDIKAGGRFLKYLDAYIWRKNLDFASLQDILSIKRQIAKKVGPYRNLSGHNIKLGKGGIREIEFFVQLHQLIWGGRQPALRGRDTIGTIHTLVKLGHINDTQCDTLIAAYEFYRKLEHRLQMVEDQQTHNMPESAENFTNIAAFMGFEKQSDFEEQLKHFIDVIHLIFTESFESEGLSVAEGNLVFTGTAPDPDTLETLASMGFQNTEAIAYTIMDWHRGSRRCTRAKLARQLLTELVPDILQALSKTVNPDEAFLKFDHFLYNLPVGVQLFSLISNNPELMLLIADIMGSAPTLSETLSRRPQLIETALFTGFYESLPDKEALEEELLHELLPIEYYDAAMERLRQFKNEKHFQAGVQLLRHISNSETNGQYLSDLADILIDQALKLTMKEFENQYGKLEGSSYAVIALGKLGSQQLTFGSDVDLMFVYDANENIQHTDLSPSTYYNRLAQRFVNALTTIGNNGALYEVDTRLRPSGQQGMLAVSKQALTKYFSEDAWTFERMALCKARAIAGNNALKLEVEKQIADILAMPRDKDLLRADVSEMRRRVEEAFGTQNIWKVKHIRGGLMDIDFIAQYILLAGLHDFPEIRHRKTMNILAATKANAVLLSYLGVSAEQLDTLEQGLRFMVQLQHMLRLTSENQEILNQPPKGLSALLTRHMKMADYEALKETLIAIEAECYHTYMKIID